MITSLACLIVEKDIRKVEAREMDGFIPKGVSEEVLFCYAIYVTLKDVPSVR